jgi:Opioid growth factor receptor (OGFr) conserved region
MSAITSFLSGTGTDHRNRKLGDIIEFEDADLEEVHDYIQWLFPLPERSAFNPFAPVLTADDIEQLRQNSSALENFRAAAERMRVFYCKNQHWLTAANHNHLRISRIIRSLSLILGHDEATRFYNEIIKLVAAVGSPVSEQSLDHWRMAKSTKGR